jgi:hypothetical protein
LIYWPNGADSEPCRQPARYNTAIVLDTDSVFHGVERISPVPAEELPPIRMGTTLDALGYWRWALHTVDGAEIARYHWEELRFSVSWKAYCFRDEHERDTWRTHADDLTLDMILDRLVDDLVERERVSADVERNEVLGQLLIDEYIRFPA